MRPVILSESAFERFYKIHKYTYCLVDKPLLLW